jgi:dihydrofolate reductase
VPRVAGMALTQYVTATTLDGYIADADNSLDWLFEVEREDEGAGFGRFLADVGAMAMGATTYEWVLDHESLLDHPERWQAMYADRPTWVFGHRELTPIPGVDLRLVQGDVVPVHAEMLAAAEGRNVWLVGGGDLVGQFHDAGLLDEVRVSITPVTLGSGAPLLPRRIEGLRLTSVERNGQMVEATYDVVGS